jgi:hypothetical protein
MRYARAGGAISWPVAPAPSSSIRTKETASIAAIAAV